MLDASYDAVIIGGGTSGLVVANYLARYGQMKVAIFEARPELGGGWSSEEISPGFTANTHAALLGRNYTLPLERDFPLEEKGFQFLGYEITRGAIFKEDHSAFCIYSPELDPEGERTAASLAPFSEQDAETWLWLARLFRQRLGQVSLEYVFNPPPRPGEPTTLEKALQELIREFPARFDSSWPMKSEREILAELFESLAVRAGFSRLLHSVTGVSPDLPGVGLYIFFQLLSTMTGLGTWRGGTHSLAHVLARLLMGEGGQFFTGQAVDKVIIRGGRAKGVRLKNGTEVEARQVVVSTLNPLTLCFQLIGRDYLGEKLIRRLAQLERWRTCITWYGWAVHELPEYKAGASLPEVNRTGMLALVSKDPLAMARHQAWRRLGRMSPELSLTLWAHSLIDGSQAPEGKHVLGSEEFVLPANQLSEFQWKTFKEKHADQVIEEWRQYAPNMTWDNVIGYLPLTPLDCTNCANYGPQGNWAVIDHLPSQLGSFRPVPELARHRTPIAGLYGTGAAWHRAGGGSSCAGYNCYKIIAQDLTLNKPWEEGGWPF